MQSCSLQPELRIVGLRLTVFVRYVLASLATNAPAHRPLHHAKPATAIKPPVKHSVHSSTVTHPPASAANVAAAVKLQERAKHSMNQAQVKLAGPAPAVQAPTVQPKSSSDIRTASRAATIRASK